MNLSWFPAIIIGAISGVLASIITSIATPMLQHRFWKKQKLGEQKLLLAERLATLIPKLVLLFDPSTHLQDRNRLIGEIDTVLFACQVLFSKPTKEACHKAHFKIKQANYLGTKYMGSRGEWPLALKCIRCVLMLSHSHTVKCFPKS